MPKYIGTLKFNHNSSPRTTGEYMASDVTEAVAGMATRAGVKSINDIYEYVLLEVSGAGSNINYTEVSRKEGSTRSTTYRPPPGIARRCAMGSRPTGTVVPPPTPVDSISECPAVTTRAVSAL